MKRQTNLHTIKLLSLAMVAAITIIIGAAFPAAAQDKPNFKVGDRVEALPSGTKWVKGTIVAIHLNFGEVNAIEVRVDDEKDYTGWSYNFDEWVKTDRMRSVSETAMANNQTDTTTTNQRNNNWKVGDRVEINHYATVWVKGTIVSLIVDENGRQAGVEVRVDDEKDYTGAQRVYRLQIEALRRINETAEEKQSQLAKQTLADKSFVKLRLDQNNNILADREVLDCDNLGIKPVKNGARPTLQTTGKVIRCPRERKGNAETVTIDITSFQIGAATKWRSYRDVGADATLNTIVYPIKTTFTEKSFTRALIYTREIETIYSCYVNTFGDWRCFHSGFKEKGETKRTPVK